MDKEAVRGQLEQLRPGVRYFLLRTAHSMLWAACDEVPVVS